MAEAKRGIRTPQEKLIAWGNDGEVSRVSWFRHDRDFSIEFWVSNRPKALREDPSLGLPCRAITIAGAGEVWIDECPGGVELHSRTPDAVYRSDPAKPHHEHCNALRGPCWTDGSSLAASEFAETWFGDDESVWALLERWVESEVKRRKPVEEVASDA